MIFINKQLTALTPIYVKLGENDFKQLAFVAKFIFKVNKKSFGF